MNIRTFREDGHYYHLEPPWTHASRNVIDRLFELNEAYQMVSEALSHLQKASSQFKERSDLDMREVSDVKIYIRKLMEATEELSYCFSGLAESGWFGGFMQDIAHAYWRVEEGRFSGAHRDQEKLNGLMGEVDVILKNCIDGGNQDIRTRLDSFFLRYATELSPDNAPSRFEEDVYEARDLYCLGYYSTALLVLGRAVESALLKLGEVRNLESIEAYNREINWDEAKFYFRNKALSRANMPEKSGKVLSDREFHQISLLVDYRNNVAHMDYADIGQDEAIRKILDAYDLLVALEEKIDYLKDLDDDEIPVVREQSVQ